MPAQTIQFPALRPASPATRVEIPFRVGWQRYNIFFECNQPVLRLTPEAGLAAAYLPALVNGSALHIKDPISPQLAANLPNIEALYRQWFPALQASQVIARPGNPAPGEPARRVGVFFSGGVDSFYTLLKHREEITDLVFVHGFDIWWGDQASPLSRQSVKMVERVAAEFGKNALIIRTNLREMLDPYLDWGDMAHGPAMFCVAHLLSGVLGRVYIASSFFAAPDDKYWGSHPALDPLWGSEGLSIVHDGLEHIRFGKLQVIADEKVVQQNLRVCWENQGGAYNCCRCEKCIRTMVCLTALGRLQAFKTFHEPLNLEVVSRMFFHNVSILANIRASMDALEQQPGQEALLSVLRQSISSFEARPAGSAHGGAAFLIRALKQFPFLYRIARWTTFTLKTAWWRVRSGRAG